MLLRASCFAVMLALVVGCGSSTSPTAAPLTPPPVSGIGTPPGAGTGLSDEQKVAAVAEKHGALHSTTFLINSVKGSGSYVAFKAGAAPTDAALADFAKDLKDVKQPIVLDLGECKPLTAAGLAPLAETKCIEGLILKGEGVKSLLPTVAKATHLRQLQVVDDTIADADLASIAGLVNLRGLVIVGGIRTTTGAAYKHFANMTELEVLDGSVVPPIVTFTDADLAHLAKLGKLKKLDVRVARDVKLSDAGLANLKGLAGLETLKLDLTDGVSPAVLDIIAGMKKLTTLDLRDGCSAPWPRSGFEKLLPLAGQLQTFSFNRSTFGGIDATPSKDTAWVATIGKFTNLDALELRGTGLTDKDLAPLAGLTKLDRLDLNFNPIAGPGLSHLKPLTKLKMLELQNAPLTDAAAPALKELPLTTLNVRGTKLTKPVLDDLEASRKWFSFIR